MAENPSNFCVLELDGWETWWKDTRAGSVKTYVSIVLFFLSAVLAHPIARSIFFLLRKFTPGKWQWPDDAKSLMMWQTSLLCRAGLLWIALVVSRLSLFLCQWPSWLFGVCLIISMDATGNLLRVVIVRKGIVGYSASELAGRKTLLHESTALVKTLLLAFVVYTYYLEALISDDNSIRLVFSTGFFGAVALAMLPLLRNVMGGHFMFLANMLHLATHVDVDGTARGRIIDAPLGFIVLETRDRAHKTFVPASGTVTATTAVIHAHFWPLELDVCLPPSTPARRVRELLQALDLLLVTDAMRPTNGARLSVVSGVSGANEREPALPLAQAAATAAGLTTRSLRSSSVAPPLPPSHYDDAARLLFELNLKDESDVLRRARGDERSVALVANERWRIRFRAFVKGSRKPRFRQIRAAYIDAITQLLEASGVGYDDPTQSPIVMTAADA